MVKEFKGTLLRGDKYIQLTETVCKFIENKIRLSGCRDMAIAC